MNTVKFHRSSEYSSQLNLNFIPFKIDHDGPAKTNEYFDSKTENNPNGNLKNNLYGRNLEGSKRYAKNKNCQFKSRNCFKNRRK